MSAGNPLAWLSERPRALLLSLGVPSRPSPGPAPGPPRSHPGSEGVPSRFPMCFVLQRGERKMRTKFFCTNFLNTPRSPGHPGKNPGTSQIPLLETPKEDKLSRADTKFSATTPSSGRPSPHRAVSGPKKFIFVLFFLA